MDETVYQLDTFVAGVLGLCSLMVVLYLTDDAARLLRPVSLAKRVGQAGVDVIMAVYPDPTRRPRPARPAEVSASPNRIVLSAGIPGVVLAADLSGLIA